MERSGTRLSFPLKRAPIRATTVWPWEQDRDHTPRFEVAPGVGYLRISAFRSYTDESVAALLEASPSLDAWIVDLRGNPGGDVQAAANVADLFCAEGVAAQLNARLPDEPLEEGEVAWNTLLPGDRYEGVPVVVLTDRHTASAAEILAAALQHHADATVVGEPTVGKGTSQELLMVESHGFALTLTTADWVTAAGTPVQWFAGQSTWGVAPDVVVRTTAAENWQFNARRRRVESTQSHRDGSEVNLPAVRAREGLPVLSSDAMVTRSMLVLSSRLGGGQ